MGRNEIEFASGGVTCRAWLYRPEADVPPDTLPCVVMAHGFGGTREAGLAPFAERFAAAGCAALVFDYRHFGASEGQPRQLLSVTRQLQDWAAALACARALPGMDPTRIVAWGTSFSGGHALVAGARDGRVAAIVCQCPMLDGLAASQAVVRYAGPWHLLRLLGHGLLDLGAALGGKAHYVPNVGPPGSLAMMTSPDAEPGFRAMAPEGFDYRVAARVGLTLWSYRPILHARQVNCPVLLLICEHDTVAPTSAAEAVARVLGPKATVQRYPVGHFDVYGGEALERSITDQIAFLQEHLLGSARA
jgi:dienelactone hydrolase